MNGDEVIWTYWENRDGSPEPPPIIGGCLESMERNGGGRRVEILTPDSVERVAPGIDPRWRSIENLANLADYVRAHVLAKHGGLWLDADTILLRDPKPLFEMLTTHEVATFRNFDGTPGAEVFACRPHAGAVEGWAAAQAELMDRTEYRVSHYTEIGSSLFATTIERSNVHWVDRSLVMPIPWTDTRTMMSRVHSLRGSLPGDAITLGVYGNWKVLANRSRDELMSSKVFTCRVLRRALDEELPDDDHRPLDCIGALHRSFVIPTRPARAKAIHALRRRRRP